MGTALRFAALVAWFLALDAGTFWLASRVRPAFASDVAGSAVAALAALLATAAAFAGLGRVGVVRARTGRRDSVIVAVMLALLWAKLFAPQSAAAPLFSWDSLPHLGLYALFTVALALLFRRLVPAPGPEA